MSQFKKGKSGNPKGKNASNFGDMIRNHPKTLDLVQKVFDIALEDGHKNQMRAMSVLMDRIAPQLKATDIKMDVDSKSGVIVLPAKKPNGLISNSRVGGHPAKRLIANEPKADA